MNAMNTVSNRALPAIVVPATRPSARPAAGPGRVEPVAVIETARLGPDIASGREAIRVAPHAESPASAMQIDDISELRLVAMAPDAADAAADGAGAASLWFLAQVLGQGSESAQTAVMDGHRDAPQIGTAAYRRADAVSDVYPEQATAFSVDV